jgi:hypothetical protein
MPDLNSSKLFCLQPVLLLVGILVPSTKKEVPVRQKIWVWNDKNMS